MTSCSSSRQPARIREETLESGNLFSSRAMSIEPMITQVPLELSGHIWLEKNCV